jgi:hypothetical protein
MTDEQFRWGALHASVIDHATAEVVTALGADNIRSILLKGPVTAETLYDDPLDRLYNDADLLVDPEQLDGARATLERLGFTSIGIEVSRHEPRPYSETWSREALIDLHHTLSGVGAPADVVWAALTGETERMQIDGKEIEILSVSGRAFVFALHAAHHGGEAGKHLRDLRRAIERVPLDFWREAAALSRRLDAEAAFGTGLRLVEGGPALAELLGSAGKRSVEAELRAGSAPHMALVLTWLARGGATPRQKLAVVTRKIFPPAEFIRLVYPVANRGRLGLAAAYVMRPIALLRRLPRTLRALWRARRVVSRADR